MAPQVTPRPHPNPAEVRELLRRLREETILPALAALPVIGIILIGAQRAFEDPLPGALCGAALFTLPVIVLLFHQRHYLVSAWVLVTGCLLADLTIVAWGHFDTAICLLAVPVGLATLFASVPAGMVTAAVCTALLFRAPFGLWDLHRALQFSALTSIWCTVGLVWLVLRELTTTVDWYRVNYERSRVELEQARDQRVRLKQALQDLADANLQLTRVDRVTTAMRQMAEDAQRAKQEFVANVSHELRTPLNMIIGYGEMIMRAPCSYSSEIPAALLADLDVILRNSRHLSSLINDILDLSQIEAGRMALTKERVAFFDIFAHAEIAVRPLFESKGLYLEVEAPADLPLVFCDRTRVREVMLNLLSNAGRFTEHGGARVRAWQEGNDIVVSVADTGIGIAPEKANKLFVPFRQLHASTNRRYGGTGLGLSISKMFVEMHGGKMWIESHEGVGTTLFFRLPIDPPASVAGGFSRWLSPYVRHGRRTRPSLAPVPKPVPRFVVMENGDFLQRLLRRYLDDPEIVSVADPDEALEELARVPSQALLVRDVSLTEPLQHLDTSSLPYNTPMIVSSMPGPDEGVDSLSVWRYLVKPISREALLSALDALDMKGKTVLIADDEPDAVRLFRRMLVSSERGYRVLRASDGHQALTILRNQRPDALLLDLVMPGMDGFQLLEAKRRDPALSDIPVVAISARDPTGQMIVSKGLAVSKRGGLSMHQLLTCVEAITEILSTPIGTADPRSPEDPGD